jgi:tagatose-1,6-bisphosphate aldolase non-catalytic subunit AgaZ/GatZ
MPAARRKNEPPSGTEKKMGSQDQDSVAPSRRTFLGGAAALGAAAALPAWPAAAKSDYRHAGGERFRVSLSVSPFTEAVLAAVSLTDGRRTARTVRQVQRLFSRHGATEVFARVATLRQARDG